ncbi:MAG: DUF2336 domain-containing protein [Pseudomonadota bacterium]
MSSTAPISAATSAGTPELAPEVTVSHAGQRAELARMLVDVLALPAGQMNENERAFVGDILIELLDFIADEHKVDTAKRLASVLAPPPNLLRRLLQEPIKVAGPLIDAFKDIPDAMLITAVQVGPEHREAIARRTRMSDGLAEALLDAEETKTCATVLAREDISLSEVCIDRLVTKTMHDEGLRAPLLHRRELQPRHGFTMFWWLSASLRQQVISRFAIDRTIMQNALKPLYTAVFTDPEPDLVVKRVLTLCDRRHRPRGKNGEAVSPEVVERMLAAVRANPTPDLCGAVGLLAGVSADTATRAILDKGGEPFAIMCKSIGVSRKVFADILSKSLLLRKANATGPRFDVEDHERLVGAFDMVARDYSRAVLRYWDWRRDTYVDLAVPA